MSAFFPTRNPQKKKRDILSEKRESVMALKKHEFTPESGSVDTYDMIQAGTLQTCVGAIICSIEQSNV